MLIDGTIFDHSIEEIDVKKNLHPTLHKILVHCACGNEFETLCTMPKLHISICSACHPFYTGKQKILDTAGRVERYKTKYAKKVEPQKKGPRAIVIE